MYSSSNDEVQLMVKVINHVNINKILKDITSLDGTVVSAGVMDSKNATKAAINEYGTSKIPQRPFMRTATSRYGKSWGSKSAKAVQSVMKGMPISQVTELIGMQMKSDISSTLTNGPWTPNAPSTIAKKGSSRPLIDTGELRASITYKVEK